MQKWKEGDEFKQVRLDMIQQAASKQEN